MAINLNLNLAPDLPIAKLEDEITNAITNNQVIILSGETGSGKSTQLPKICAKIRDNINNNKNIIPKTMIAHTQPRRVAAVSLAQRISDEVNSDLGEYVGYQIRFNQQVSENTQIKLMTDGMLLTEIQTDRLLKKYHTIIIDEAHERSLNIDFLLGYIKNILPKRPDLKVIITSATIEVDLFSKHFNNAPVLHVPGRTYPVDIIYKDLNQDSVIDSVLDAIDLLWKNNNINNNRVNTRPGDILVFFATEREINEAALLLERKNIVGMEVVKIFARLSPKEQQKVFNPGKLRRVILSTNVAETSVTVPRVHYVIDTGLARISRYSYRSKMQHLPIESIPKSSAKQRSGRCGRIAPGICIRLYSEDDFINRDEQMSPEICRTNLSSVILLMLAYKLGDINDFPFLESPDSKYIKDGFQVLFELGAVEEVERFELIDSKIKNNNKKYKNIWRLTEIGKKMSRFPVDPRISRMILAAQKYHCIDEVLIIASFLSAQDPRIRPADKSQKADQLHREFRDDKSDFIEILNLWDFINFKKSELSNSQFKSMCQKRFLSSLKIRQWQAIYQQLGWVVKNLKIDYKDKKIKHNKNIDNKNIDNKKIYTKNILEGAEYEKLHKALMSGLVTHVARINDKNNDKKNDKNKNQIKSYLSTRSRQGFIFPGSGLFKKNSKWVLSCYLRETSKVYFDCNAKIEPQWIEDVARHLVKRNYDEPIWSKKREQASVKERVSLYGLEIGADKWVFYGNIDKSQARDMLIRNGLVEGQINLREDFFLKNNELLEDIEEFEDKIRSRGVLIDPYMLEAHYDKVLPDHIVSGVSLKKWLKNLSVNEKNKLLYVKSELEGYAKSQDSRVENINTNNYPQRIKLGTNQFLLSYKFELGDDTDGVSVEIPLPLVKSIRADNIYSHQWLIPALLQEKITAFIKALPKAKRKLCAPAPDYAKALFQKSLEDDRVPHKIGLLDFMAESLTSMTGHEFKIWDWQGAKSISEGGQIENHLFLRFVITDKNKILISGRDLNFIIQSLDNQKVIKKHEEEVLIQDDIKWETSWVWDEIPENRKKEINGVLVEQYPALFINDDKTKVGLGWENDKKNQYKSFYNGLVVLCKNHYSSCLKKIRSRSDIKSKFNNLKIYWARLSLDNKIGDLWDVFSGFCVQEGVGLFNNNMSESDFIIKTKSEYLSFLKPDSEIIKALVLWSDNLLELFKQESECQSIIKKSSKQLGSVQINDLKSQLDWLFYFGFLSKDNKEHLNRYKVYLKAIKIRCEAAINNPLKARMAYEKLSDYWQRFCDYIDDNLGENLENNKTINQELLNYKYLVEEYRISVFAQSLGCVKKVSEKKLEQAWESIYIK